MRLECGAVPPDIYRKCPRCIFFVCISSPKNTFFYSTMNSLRGTLFASTLTRAARAGYTYKRSHYWAPERDTMSHELFPSSDFTQYDLSMSITHLLKVRYREAEHSWTELKENDPVVKWLLEQDAKGGRTRPFAEAPPPTCGE